MLLQVLAGPDDRDVITLREQPPDYLASLDGGVKGLKIAWSPDLGYAAVDPEVVKITSEAARAFEELGAVVEEAEIVLYEPFTRLSTITLANSYAAYGHLLEERPDDLTEYVRDRLEKGRQVKGVEYTQALRSLEELQARMAILMESYDILLIPTMAVPAFPVGQRPGRIDDHAVDPDWAFNPFNFVFNLTRQPAASVPCGFTSQGLPVGLQIVGRLRDEVTVLQASAAFESVQPWAKKHPPVS